MAHCANSRLVCKISGEVMNENNPPMMLPNGYVYGYNVSTHPDSMKSGQSLKIVILVLLILPLSLFCQFAKMTKWCVPEPKKSSTSLRQRKSTSCDLSDGAS